MSFTAGAAYGLTSVAVGQPFDTIKTRMHHGFKMLQSSLSPLLYSSTPFVGL